MKRLLSRLYFWLTGWEFDLNFRVADVPKCVLIGAPHTSNWDFVYSILSFWYFRVPFRFFIKDSWTKPWYGFFFKSLGAIGIDRSSSANRVAYAAQLLKESDRLYLLNTPEGSRSRAEKWKSGFYYIALEAEVPIVLGYCDYQKKKAGLAKIIYPNQKTKDEVFSEIEAFYKNIKGKFPEKYNPKIF